MKVGELGRL